MPSSVLNTEERTFRELSALDPRDDANKHNDKTSDVGIRPDGLADPAKTRAALLDDRHEHIGRSLAGSSDPNRVPHPMPHLQPRCLLQREDLYRSRQRLARSQTLSYISIAFILSALYVLRRSEP